MSLKEFAAKILSNRVVPKLYASNMDGAQSQMRLFHQLIQKGATTAFGKDRRFSEIKDYEAFKKQVPVNDYKVFEPYVKRVLKGEKDVLWPGLPEYFAKTSGTTSGAKYIPITKESMPTHIAAARNALLTYIYNGGDTSFVNEKMIFLQGSPVLDSTHKVKTGRLSGIVAHYVPGYLQKNRMPSWKVNSIEDWETKLDAIIEETLPEKMSLISGIPPWVQMYFEKILEKTGAENIGEVFKDFSLFVYGGVNFKPYQPVFERLIGKQIPSIELFPASEGFFAFQDKQGDETMLLNTDAGVFYEFIPQSEWGKEDPIRIGLADVEIGVKYAMVISTTAGLWAYDLGDVVKFTSIKPYKLVVSGRVKHFTSAFGEHVIAEEVEKAIAYACSQSDARVIEFTVAPQLAPAEGNLPYHEWLIEFEREPKDQKQFIQLLESKMQEQNPYYRDLIKGKILEDLHITMLKKGAFVDYMRRQGKLGGQNKTPRLSNNRDIAQSLCNSSVI